MWLSAKYRDISSTSIGVEAAEELVQPAVHASKGFPLAGWRSLGKGGHEGTLQTEINDSFIGKRAHSADSHKFSFSKIITCFIPYTKQTLLSLPPTSWSQPPRRKTPCTYSSETSIWRASARWQPGRSQSSQFLAPWTTAAWKLTTSS